MIRRYAIKWALKKPSPSRIPLDRERAQANDHYVTRLKDKAGNIDLILRDEDKNAVYGLSLVDGKYQYELALPWKFVPEAELEITHYFKHAQAKYTGAWDFLWGNFTRKPRRYLAREAVTQWFFNKTTRFRHERISILQEIIENHLRKAAQSETFAIFDETYRFDTMSFFQRKYGVRGFEHPSFNREYEMLNLTLKSLVASGDLEKDGNEYRIAPTSLKTVADYELNERRHRDSVRHNWLIFWLTVVIALSTAFSVLVDYNGWKNAPPTDTSITSE